MHSVHIYFTAVLQHMCNLNPVKPQCCYHWGAHAYPELKRSFSSEQCIDYLCEIIDLLEVIFFKMTVNLLRDTMETVILYCTMLFSEISLKTYWGYRTSNPFGGSIDLYWNNGLLFRTIGKHAGIIKDTVQKHMNLSDIY